MKYALLLALAVLLADSTSSTTVRLAGEFGQRVEIDSVTTISTHNGNFIINRKRETWAYYPMHIWTIEGVKKRGK